MWPNYGQKPLLVAVESGYICFTKPFLLKIDCEISGWRFLNFGSFMRVFTVRGRKGTFSDEYSLL